MTDNAPLRLLVVTRDRYPAFRVDLTELFGRHLVRRFRLTWAMARAAPGPGGVIEADGQRFALAGCCGRQPLDALRLIGLQIRMATWTAGGGFDLVQVRDAALSALLLLVAARLGRVPFAYWMSFPILESYRARSKSMGGWRGTMRLAYAAVGSFALYRIVLPLADHIFVQSDRMAADLAALGLPRDRMTSVPMAVSTAVFNPVTVPVAEDGRLKDKTVLVYQGALEPERGLGILAGVLARIVAAGYDAVLVLVGGARAADAEALHQTAVVRGVGERLVFTGALPLNQALSYVRRADVCLSPYPVAPPFYLSATPTKLVEYLAMGRPVVANAHPDQSWVIASSGAGLVAPLSEAGFAEAVLTLLAAREVAEVMGSRGPAWVEANRDYRRTAAAVAARYRRLADRKRAE